MARSQKAAHGGFLLYHSASDSPSAKLGCLCNCWNTGLFYFFFLLFCCSSPSGQDETKQGRIMFLSNLMSVCAREGTLSNQRVFALEFACASMRAWHICKCVCACCVYHKQCVFPGAFVYVWACVCAFTPRARVVLFLCQSIERPRLRRLVGWCDKGSVCVCMSVGVCVSGVCLAVDQCSSNHPTGAMWSPITLFKQTGRPDAQTFWCLTDYWMTSLPAHSWYLCAPHRLL